MEALRLTAWKHDPEIQEVPAPEAGPGQVVVRIGGAGACHSDLHLMHDFEDGVLPWGPPFTLGHENAGWVDAVGAGVTSVEVGEPVAVYGPWGCGRCRRCRMGMENYCERQAQLGAAGGGLGLDGGMAERMLVPDARLLVPLGDLDPVEAAPLTDAGLTPYHAIARSRHLLVPGSTAVVVGVGGLGHMAVQILKAISSATVVAVDQSDVALSLARDIGADHAVRSGPDAQAEVMEATGGRGAELVLDVVGVDATLALAAAVVGQVGHLTILGIGGGTLPVSFFGLPYEAAVATTYWGTVPELFEVVALASRGLIRPTVHRVGLDGAVDAYERMAAGTVEGRVVVVP
ncbi:NAD(P)-dependent alcohol dehydrogenase [Iamia sp. SCSIO 61187]|uniref:NAD(P)-dependent alcohol dehydrogenase n=1 Tax=Iamia sp. SCSIO 61187 TaxID=2722752 RepID=UPI001C632205|nr:NAD(P)-dependent alcohol dehydrogenase [Iamia sp. SCSIO 61187]QYG93532.1 NAD(P)-dependent alcohol dehydrogenase [Iamia sp. SCSIO 61187]